MTFQTAKLHNLLLLSATVNKHYAAGKSIDHLRAMLIVHIIVLIVGAALIIAGASWVTSGASAVARRVGVSDFVIGMTLVALGSSAPDLAVGVISAIKGHTQFAIGNVVGSDTFDGWLVIGVVALIRPLHVDGQLRLTQLPMLIVAYAVIFVCANSIIFGGTAVNVITRGDGILMVLIFALMTWAGLKSGETRVKSHEGAEPSTAVLWRPWRTAGMILAGLGMLVGGGDMFVDGASGIAVEAHMSETLIGLTVVALGTSLPDLATSAVAAWRGHTAMAVGNAVGSCLMDALLVLGCSATVCPLPMDGVSNIDLAVMAASAVFFLIVSQCRRDHTVGRWPGAVMVVVYVAYVAWLIVSKG